MGDAMQLLPFGQLLGRVIEEYHTQRSIFGIEERTWYRPHHAQRLHVMRDQCDLPLGPAAGPHTQLAQNIISAYLTGSRFFELKTVQIMDSLEIEKPCIDAADEGYNVEWSTELSLDKAWQEYARAWLALHVLEELFGLAVSPAQRSFTFNMSVGYDLKGIMQERMQEYIDRMIGARRDQRVFGWLDELEADLPRLLRGSGLTLDVEAIARLRERAGQPLCSSVTLSTMHGCPPQEIESICRYLLMDKKLDTYVKLNPTLLGIDTVGAILRQTGYRSVELDTDGFAHDLQFETALGILQRLRAVSADCGRGFGAKLTNTLAVNNTRNALPGTQMYMSGRALYPIAITLAARIATEFKGELPISYCGGITVHNAAAVLQTGIRPLTLCTVLLKPGGYALQAQIARELETVPFGAWDGIDHAAVRDLAAAALGERSAHKAFRGTDEVRIEGTLPTFDCYQAPCVTACAINQHVPEYIRLVGEQRFDEAVDLIYQRNALPGITGHICDHQCQYVCSRLDYEGCVNIRELKKIAVQQGGERFRARHLAPQVTRTARCAVIGAGPAGLSCAFFLARHGFAVTLFEREPNAGGVVRNVIPHFRLPVEAIEADVAYIAAQGVTFEFGCRTDLTAAQLRAQGFGPIFVSIGAEVSNELVLCGDQSRVMRSLDFLWDYRGNRPMRELGQHVVVVGGGNTAMDAARAALTIKGVQTVEVLYRRSEAEMPADREEYENALEDGVRFHFLQNPEAIAPDGTVTVRVMSLGQPDASGRRQPLPTDRTEVIHATTLITAISERVDHRVLARFGIPVDDKGRVVTNAETLETTLADVYLGGDARTGPSTVVRCIASGRRAAEAIAQRDDAALMHREAVPNFEPATRLAQVSPRKTVVTMPLELPKTEDQQPAFAQREHERCMECSFICNRCVEVCPNRANITVAVQGEDGFNDPFQIVHLDAYCNECGNCGHFCPWSERVPYRDKPTVYSTRATFEAGGADGWFLENGQLHARFGGQHRTRALDHRTTHQCGAAEMRFWRLFELLHRQRPTLFGTTEEMR